MSPIPFRCASASALRRRVAKAVSHLLLRRLCLVPLPLPPQLSTAGYRDPGQLQGAASLHTPVVAVRFLPPCLPLRLRKWKTVATQRFCFLRALRVESQNGYVVAFRAKTEAASLPAPLCYPCPPATPLSLAQRSSSRVRIRIRACA